MDFRPRAIRRRDEQAGAEVVTIETDLQGEVIEAIQSNFESREGRVVPEDNSVTFGNDAVKINAVVLYADLAESTNLVEKYLPEFVAKCVKSFLLASARLVRYFEGKITAYDGDRIMAVYIGERARTRAARTALAINWAMNQVINPELKKKYTFKEAFYLGHAAGIDVSDLFAIKTGIRTGSDLAWIGRAANKAAKLSGIREPYYFSYIDTDVFAYMAEDAKTYQGQALWEARSFPPGGRQIYRSGWWLTPSHVG